MATVDTRIDAGPRSQGSALSTLSLSSGRPKVGPGGGLALRASHPHHPRIAGRRAGGDDHVLQFLRLEHADNVPDVRLEVYRGTGEVRPFAQAEQPRHVLLLLTVTDAPNPVSSASAASAAAAASVPGGEQP